MKVEELELHEKFTQYGRNAKEWQRKCALLLPEIVKRRIWHKKGFSSVYEYAAKLAGMSRYQVRETLRILGRIKDKPALIEVAKNRGVNAVRPVATIATPETSDYWAEKSQQMAKNELEAFVRATRLKQVKHSTTTITMELSPEVADQLKKINNGDWNKLMEEFLKFRQEALEQEKPLPVKTKSTHIPKPIRDYVHKRSNGKCEFPHCNNDYDERHHINRHASDHLHDPDQIAALCRSHHQLAHRSLIAGESSVQIQKWQVRKHPDLATPSYYVDQKVQFYRRT